MSITFAGQELLLEAPDDQLPRFLERFQSLKDLRLFGQPQILPENARTLPGCPPNQSVAFPVPNWPEPPALRLNTLYWPLTGASRWATFLGLVDEDRLDKIITKVKATQGAYGQLELSEGESHRKNAVRTSMYVLPPRRISSYTAGAKSGRLWLLPLVDERYLWAIKDVADFTASAIGSTNFTWTNFIAASRLGSIVPFTALGIDADTISADYFKPDALAFDNKSQSVASVLDALAESVGMRIVVDVDSKVYLMNTARSAQRLQDSLSPVRGLESGYDQIAGGAADKYNALKVPQTVSVLFPKWWLNGQYYAVDTAYSTVLDPATLVSTGKKVIYSTAQAEYNDSNVITNAADCATLAARIARDFFNWQTQVYDYTFDGIKAWKGQGYDDAIVHAFGRRRPGECDEVSGEPLYDAYTRVQSLPLNFGTAQQLQSFRFSASRGAYEARMDAPGHSIASVSPTFEDVHLSVQAGDLDGFNLATYEVTVDSAGLYVITMSVEGQVASAGNGAVELFKDSGAGYGFVNDMLVNVPYVGGSNCNGAKTQLIRLAAGDKVKLMATKVLGAAWQLWSAALVIRPA